MAKISIPGGDVGYMATTADHFVLAADQNLSSSMSAFEAHDAQAAGLTVTIKGTIDNSNTGVSLSGDAGDGNHVAVAAGGSISGQYYAVYFDGDENMLVNRGTLGIDDTGYRTVSILGFGNVVENEGDIKGKVGLYFQHGDNVVRNSGTIDAMNDAIVAGNEVGETMRVVNSGTISSEKGLAYSGYVGRDVFVNHGTVSGDVLLGAGDNLYVNRGGAVNGTITTGTGDDVFVLDRADLVISDHGGHDLLKTSIDWTLTGNFEDVRLLGKHDLDVTGDMGDNRLTGNTGRNVIDGAAGIDTLVGGRGNDSLAGGSEADTFEFKAHSGRDVIEDFTDGVDLIDLSGYRGIDRFSDLAITDTGTDTLIKLAGGDVIRLASFEAADLSKADFDF